MEQPSYLILTALAAGRRHGYGIVADIDQITAGEVHLRAGTLYAALDRLAAAGLIAEDGSEVVDGRHRRYYVLTSDGGAELESEARRLARRSQAALRRLKAATA